MTHVFLSHASADDAFVAELRQALEDHRIPVWVDSRSLRGGSKLAPEITTAITQARHFIAVLSPSTVNSPWVRREIQQALEVERGRRADGYRVIPLLLPGLSPAALGNWFETEPVAVPVAVGPGGLAAAWPAILAALGERLPADREPFSQPEARPVEELVLALEDPGIETGEGMRRARATARVVYEPAAPGARRVESRRFTFTAPLGPIEAAELHWYLETYHIWPDAMAQQRAQGIANRLPHWGQALHQAALGGEAARSALTAWQHSFGSAAEHRFSVQVDREPAADAATTAAEEAGVAATELLALPWELLHDGGAWLFQGREPVRVRRRLPNRNEQPARPTAIPVRILLVSPRPERDAAGNRLGFFDHRASARPLVEAVEGLGELARLTILQPPTYAALEQALLTGDEGEPFDVVHFDGHGVYDRRQGLGALYFEEPAGDGEPPYRSADRVDAVRLGGLVHRHRIPLVVLDACQSAVADLDPTASVAGRLLEEGVSSVVAMSHSVLVETARRFVAAFYGEIARGARVGRAMLAGQQALHADPRRGRVLGAGELRLHDWFVPVLYQEEHDPQLVTRIPPGAVQQLEARRRRLRLGALPAPPPHRFQGRSRELLDLERLLHRERWAVVCGTGGQGKTTLAVELARWLTQTARFASAAFVSLERHRDAGAVLDALGHQLLPEGEGFTVAAFRDLDEALRPVERALADHATVVVIDNCESVLPERDAAGGPGPAADDAGDAGDASDAGDVAHAGDASAAGDAGAAIFELCRRLLEADPRTRLVFTSREALPAPFAAARCQRELGALAPEDAVELVSEVMKQHGWAPAGDDAGSTPAEVEALVEAVHCHARALVLLAPEVARRGVRATTADLRSLMAELERRHPGDRESSLYASVELSLRRLPAGVRQQVSVLAVCQGGACTSVCSPD